MFFIKTIVMQKKFKGILLPLLLVAFFALLLINSCKKDQAPVTSSDQVHIENFTPTKGAMTTEVLINGSGFIADTSRLQVAINGVKLAIVGASASQIMVVVPPKLRSGPIEVTIDGHLTATSDSIFNYIASYSVSTLAGSGVQGYSGGQGTAAQFFFTDTTNPWIRPTGIVVNNTTKAIYVADANNYCVRKIDALGNTSIVAGNPNGAGSNDATGMNATFSIPYGLTIDPAGNLYLADVGNGNIRKITPDGTTSTIHTPTAPWGIALDSINNVIYYTATGSSEIYRMPLSGTDAFQSQVICSNLLWPAGITVDKNGNVYSAISGANEIVKLAKDSWAQTVVAGTSVAGYANGPATTAQFNNPWGLAIDQYGNLYTAGNGSIIPKNNSANNGQDNAIRIIDAETSIVSTIAGSTSTGFTNGLGAIATFSNPAGVAVDNQGNLYVLDKMNNAVRKITVE